MGGCVLTDGLRRRRYGTTDVRDIVNLRLKCNLGPIGAYALGTMPKCGDEYEEPDEEDPKGSVPMIVITDTQGINQIYICEWMLWNIAIQANEAQIYRTGIFHPDSMNALELRDRMDAWPLGTDWFGENSWSFIDKFVQFDMMLLEAVRYLFLRSR